MFRVKGAKMSWAGMRKSELCPESMDYILGTDMDWERDEFEGALFNDDKECTAQGYARQPLIQRFQFDIGGREHFSAADLHFGPGDIPATSCVIFHILDGKATPIFRFRFPWVMSIKGVVNVQWSNEGIFWQEKGAIEILTGRTGATEPKC